MTMPQPPAAYRVLCDGVTVGEFRTHEDAQDFTNLWNSAYPASALFTVDRPCADPDCNYCGDTR